MILWLSTWSFRVQESLAMKLPYRWHERICPFCRAAAAWIREQEQARA